MFTLLLQKSITVVLLLKLQLILYVMHLILKQQMHASSGFRILTVEHSKNLVL